jgi:hypothetical protein
MDNKTKIGIGVGVAVLLGLGYWAYTRLKKEDSLGKLADGSDIDTLAESGAESSGLEQVQTKPAVVVSPSPQTRPQVQTKPAVVVSPPIQTSQIQYSRQELPTSNVSQSPTYLRFSGFDGMSDYVEVGSDLTDLN